jgi:uncharacterized protein
MISRELAKNIETALFKGNIIIIYGARQVGKTTLALELAKSFEKSEVGFFDCDLVRYRNELEKQDEVALQNLVRDKKIVIIDEAQRVQNIGLSLKILHTYFPKTQFIATGSSSFELANKINEPLTGRSKIFNLFPLSVSEIRGNDDDLTMQSKLNDLLVYGMYPAVYNNYKTGAEEKLENLVGGYIYQDLLQYEDIKKPYIIDKLLRLLAFQIGSEVSYSELASKLSINTVTVQKYIDLLEKSFIIFTLSGFSRNLRNEINKSPKIYFNDLGVRNALIQNFNTLEYRDDVGRLWENFLIIERKKRLEYDQFKANSYFWRNYQKQEIDYIHESGGEIKAFEFKWGNNKRTKIPNSFAQAYPSSTFEVVNKENWLDFVL